MKLSFNKGGFSMPITNVLIIDDEERFLQTTQKLLEKQGYTVYTATEGFRGITRLKVKRIDVVILDVKMPGMDGVAVLRKIKADFPLVEVVMLTGHSTVESAIEGLKLGAFDYLTKPCDIPVLIQKIDEAGDKKKSAEEKIRKARLDRIISHPLELFSEDE
jgi:DNA-binding NtrC family response regulator